jgi:hypothetical protein
MRSSSRLLAASGRKGLCLGRPRTSHEHPFQPRSASDTPASLQITFRSNLRSYSCSHTIPPLVYIPSLRAPSFSFSLKFLEVDAIHSCRSCCAATIPYLHAMYASIARSYHDISHSCIAQMMVTTTGELLSLATIPSSLVACSTIALV